MVRQVRLLFKQMNSSISFLTDATLKLKFKIEIEIVGDNAEEY